MFFGGMEAAKWAFNIGDIMSVKLTLFVILLSLAGCTTLNEVMSSWEGHPADELLALWGAPHSRMPLNNGGQVLTWESTEGNYQYGYRTCRKSFTTNADGIIERWSYSGCQKIISK